MEEEIENDLDDFVQKPTVNLRQYQMPKVKKWYLYKLIFYVILLSILIYFVIQQSKDGNYSKPTNQNLNEIEVEFEDE